MKFLKENNRENSLIFSSRNFIKSEILGFRGFQYTPLYICILFLFSILAFLFPIMEKKIWLDMNKKKEMFKTWMQQP